MTLGGEKFRGDHDLQRCTTTEQVWDWMEKHGAHTSGLRKTQISAARAKLADMGGATPAPAPTTPQRTEIARGPRPSPQAPSRTDLQRHACRIEQLHSEHIWKASPGGVGILCPGKAAA